MRPSIVAGAAVGLATGAWMFAEYALGLHEGGGESAGRWTGFLSLIFPVIGAVWTVRASRPSVWTSALREGVIFGGVSGVVGGVAIYAYFTFVNPDFAIGGRPVGVAGQVLTGFTGSLVVGAILTLVAYAVLNKRGQAT